MMSYTHFTLVERKCLQELLSEGKTVRAIASALGRSPSTISREIGRNRNKHKYAHTDNRYCYHFWRAQIQAIERRRRQRPRALEAGSPAWDYIIDRLKAYWSPETICAVWNRDHPGGQRLNHATLYRYLKQGLFPGVSRRTHLRRRGKLKRPRNAPYNTIHPDRIIPDWPPAISGRARIGDWEGDTLYGGIGKGLLVTLVDRKSRFLRAVRVRSRNADEVRSAIVTALKGLPVHSISLDNGSEFSQFHAIESALDTLVYFAEPHKPWQRGTNENTNGLLRFFFPKGYDFLSLAQSDLDSVVDLINARPRKCLDWASPAASFSVALR